MLEIPSGKRCYYCYQSRAHAEWCPNTYTTRVERLAAACRWRNGWRDAHCVPDYRGPHGTDPTYMMGWMRADILCRGMNGPRVPEGSPFVYDAFVGEAVDTVRSSLCQLYGRKVFIAYQIGPWEPGPSCPITIVDAPRLEGAFGHFPPLYSNDKVFQGWFL